MKIFFIIYDCLQSTDWVLTLIFCYNRFWSVMIMISRVWHQHCPALSSLWWRWFQKQSTDITHLLLHPLHWWSVMTSVITRCQVTSPWSQAMSHSSLTPLMICFTVLWSVSWTRPSSALLTRNSVFRLQPRVAAARLWGWAPLHCVTCKRREYDIEKGRFPKILFEIWICFESVFGFFLYIFTVYKKTQFWRNKIKGCQYRIWFLLCPHQVSKCSVDNDQGQHNVT